MFMEGEVNWVLVLSAVTAVSLAVAVLALIFAVSRGARHATTSSELDVVQEAASAAETRLFETLNAVPVALVQTDEKGKFVFANRAAHHLLGRRDAELLGLRFHSATWGITFPDGRPVPPDLLPTARALRGQTVKGFQHLLANPASRRKMPVSVTAMPIENARGEITGSIAAIVETESAASLEAFDGMATGADLTRRVFDAAASALVVVDVHGRLRDINAAALAVLGRDEPVEGEFVELFLDEDERVVGRQTLRAALKTPAGEIEPLTSRRDVAWRILPLADAEGRIDALLLAGERIIAAAETQAVVDIPAPEPVEVPAPEPDARDAEIESLRQAAETARLDAEAAIAAAAQAREEARVELEGARRMESVGRLTGGLAQDFTAMLGVMTSALDMMLRQADDPARVRRLGEAALTAGQKGVELTRRLTAFSQGEDGAPIQVLDASLLLKGMETRLRELAGPDVDLMIESPAGPAPVRLDPVMFEGAVRALVQNAVEAVAGRGSVAVRLETPMEGGLRLTVRDSGAGMNTELAARALEPFFTTREGAAGLGLSQAHAFARQSGGRLSIDSVPGEGAEVAITLPLAE